MTIKFDGLTMNQLAERTAELQSKYEAVVAELEQVSTENAQLKQVISDIHSELYGQGFQVAGWHLNGDLEALDTWFEDNDWNPETPATDKALANIRNEAIESAIPEGFVVVPDRINLPAESMEGICFHCGDGGHQFGAFTEGTLFIGEVENDDGSKVYGIHIATADYPEEGCATICEFSQPLCKESAIHEQ